ncbi:MAG: glucosamine-6-phosphate deaminase [Clostridia bacterium]|nr:glucosamine-6-phosphate deaminase [Clostridia bacterium]
MKIIKAKNYKELSTIAADVIAAQILGKPDSVIGLATGSTPIGTYAELAEKCNRGELDFSAVTTVNLDEYVGLGGDHPQSYRYFMNRNLFERINVRPECTFVPNGCAEDLAAECRAYDARIEQLGGVDLQLLGIGIDGHIGFNEPDDCFTRETHEVTLDESTIEANSRFFASPSDVPRTALTMGMGAIMGARKILMVVNGKNKEDILRRALQGPITPLVPASILQLHPDVTVVYSEE